MLRRWLKSSCETPHDEYLPNPCLTPEKSVEISAANGAVVQAVSKSLKRKRGKYNHYSAEQRYKMAKYAVENGVMKASKHFSKVLGKPVNESSIRTMKKSYILKKVTTESDEFQDGLPCNKRGRPTLLGTFEEDVIDYIKNLRLSGGIVNRPIVIAAACGIIMAKNRQHLVEFGGSIDLNNSWAQSFLRRLNFVQRKGTKAARKLPENFPEQKELFLSKIEEIVTEKRIPDDLIINVDQTNVYIVPVGDFTLEEKGSKQVPIIGLEDKRQITVLLGCTMSGYFLPLKLSTQAERIRFTRNFHSPMIGILPIRQITGPTQRACVIMLKKL